MPEPGVASPSQRSASPLVARARVLAPLFSELAEANEAGGRLTPETVEALRSGDFFGLMVARCFGGAEASPLEALEIFETISEADASTGWVLMACNVGTGSAAGYLPPRAAQKVFDGRIPIIAGHGAPLGRADVEGEGFRLTGRWSYGSGVLHASWLHTGGRVFENGEPRLNPATGQPEARIFVVPIEHAEILGNWDVVGLRATGSVDYALNDVYVPEEFSHSPDANVPRQGGDLFRLGIVGMSPLGHSAIALGIGRRVLDELRALALSPSGRPSSLSVQGGDQGFQESYAEAEAKFRAARAFCYETWRDVSATLSRGEAVARRQYTLTRLSLAHVTSAVSEICTFAHKTGGGVSLRNGALQRCFRDIFAATQHRIVSDFILRECGRELLGAADDKLWATRGLVDAYIDVS